MNHHGRAGELGHFIGGGGGGGGGGEDLKDRNYNINNKILQ